MGYKAVEAIEQGNLNTVIVQQKGEYIAMPIEDALAAPKVFNEEMYDIMKILAK